MSKEFESPRPAFGDTTRVGLCGIKSKKTFCLWLDTRGRLALKYTVTVLISNGGFHDQNRIIENEKERVA